MTTHNSHRIHTLQRFMRRIAEEPTYNFCDDADRRYALREMAYCVVQGDRQMGRLVSRVSDVFIGGEV